jgi:hypothetical protein
MIKDVIIHEAPIDGLVWGLFQFIDANVPERPFVTVITCPANDFSLMCATSGGPTICLESVKSPEL